ncbi:transforming growth factor-beta-induced protein ig-h3-like [Mya arenaria]|uniref:transforming growth factor-beta-induced protein ig-h3-like n=1 Tax=Mya arenaria TaxID=6604 RepID=UPI0022E61B04|nr:transforming growth factor-beta-induced protein ig-h3-like [Mya arenaria]
MIVTMECLFLLLGFVVSAYGQTTVLDVLRRYHDTTLYSLIQTAGLDTALSGTGPFTVFAPSNTAFLRSHVSLTSLKSDPAALAQLLKLHVVSGKLMLNDLKVNEKTLTALSGETIRVNYYMYYNRVTVDGAYINSPNHVASNGVVHMIDHLMLPPNGSIPDILASTPELSTLNAAIQAAGLGPALAEGPFTLFAPTNAAFNSLGNATVQALLADTELLKSILLYHVIHGTLYTRGMHSGSLNTLEAVDREHLLASSSSVSTGTPSVDRQRITKRDVSASNGVIHEISHVLIPASFRDAVSSLITP